MLWDFKSSHSLQGGDKNSKKKNDPSLLITAKNSIVVLIKNIHTWIVVQVTEYSGNACLWEEKTQK